MQTIRSSSQTIVVPPTPLRSWRERAIQTLAFEIGGLFLAVPIYAALFDRSANASVGLIVLLSMIVLAWSPLHNTLFDLAESRLACRVASDRPQWLRCVHAFSHETTAVLISLPAILTIGGHDLESGLLVNLSLTLLYTCYAYIFHLAYDRLRPVNRDLALSRLH